MKIKYLITLFSLILIIFTGSALAENTTDFYVSVDGNDDNAGNADNPFATLGKAISSINSSENTIIYLGEGQYSASGNTNLNINGGNVSIVGNGKYSTFINGELLAPVFSSMSSSSTVSIQGIAFVNCYAQNGGAIQSNANLNIKDCLFENNYANGNFGGAIYWQNYGKNNITIENTEFIQNQAGYRGGALYIFGLGTCNIENCVFSNNNIANNFSYGSNVYAETWYSNIVGNVFKDTTTTANSFDGGVYLSTRLEGNIINNSFINCVNGGDKNGILYLEGNNYVSGNVFTNSTTSVGEIYNGGVMNVLISVDNFTIHELPKELNLSASITDIDGNVVNGGKTEIFVNNELINTTTLLNSKVNANYLVVNSTNYEILVKYTNQTGTGSIVVLDKKNSTTVLSYINNSDNSITLFASVSADGGDVLFVVNGSEYVKSILNGGANLTLTNLAPGNYSVVANYSGSEEYNPSSDSLNFIIHKTIEKYYSTIELSVNVDKISKNVTITAICSSNGTVIFTVNGEKINTTTVGNIATLTLLNLKDGKYDVIANYTGNNQYESSINTTSFLVSSYELDGKDMTLYYRNGARFTVRLTYDDQPVVGEVITININGISYNYVSNDKGVTSIPLNLNPGVYTVISNYSDIVISNKVIIKPTLTGDNLTKYFKNQSQYTVHAISGDGKSLNEGKIEFNINGVFYYRTVKEGSATLDINLPAGEYIVTAVAPNGDTISNNITVLPIIVDNSNLIKYYRNNSQYIVKLLDEQGNPIGGETVQFNINGVFYTRISNGDGIAIMDINLPPGEYIITGQYNGFIISNNVTVLSTIESNNLEMSNNHRLPFIVKVLDSHGNTVAGVPLSFNINGIFYNRISDSDGIAKLDINLPLGEYIITTEYDKLMQSNTIVIF